MTQDTLEEGLNNSDTSGVEDIQAPDLGEVALSPQDEEQLEQYRQALSQSVDMTYDQLASFYYQERPYLEDAALHVEESVDYPAIAEAYGMDEADRARLESKGFVILPDVRFDSLPLGYQDSFVRDLPVLITVDSILLALHKSYDRMLMRLESNGLMGVLETVLSSMHQGIPALSAENQEPGFQAAVRDADLFLAVALTLLTGESQTLHYAENAVALADILAGVESLSPRAIQLFGRTYPCAGPGCAYDFSQFKPRGHYTMDESLERYFRAMMWLGRTQAFVSRYPREFLFTHVLHRLLVDGGAMADWNRLDRAIAAFVGESDNLTHTGYQQFLDDHPDLLSSSMGDADQLAAWMASLETGQYGNQKILSQIIAGDPMEEEPGFLPPVYCFLGQRFVLDSYVFNWVVYDRIRWLGAPVLRMMPDPLDALFVLGHQEALPLLKNQIDTYHYAGNLHVLKTLVDSYDDSFWDASMYSVWLSTLGLLGADFTGQEFPAFMRTRDYAIKNLQTVAASWAELRHDTILYAKQSYTGITCDYPDGYVEPVPEFYARLGEFATRSSELLGNLGFSNAWGINQVESFFGGFAETMRILEGISEKELAGLPRDPDETEFIKSLVVDESMCGGPPFSGWYSELFFEGEDLVFDFSPTIADVHTDPNSSEVMHVGTGFANPMVVLLSNHCGVRSYVGPVSSFYVHFESDFGRLTDEDWASRMKTDPEPPRPSWTATILP